eukprot:GHVU01220498.1.p1 GENE.GHVU01220498.1~~GHVU01220498.1.p1  ORF type:complete len:521 (-),score=33.61 GHVU01220498.1:164-1726(-)
MKILGKRLREEEKVEASTRGRARESLAELTLEVDVDSLGVMFSFMDATNRLKLGWTSKALSRVVCGLWKNAGELVLEEQRSNHPEGYITKVAAAIARMGMDLSELRRLHLVGKGAAICFTRIWKGHGPCRLKTLNLTDCGNNMGADKFRGNVERLESVHLRGKNGPSALFSFLSRTCASSLRRLSLSEPKLGLSGAAMRGNYKNLESVALEGGNASYTFAKISSSCAASLRELTLEHCYWSKAAFVPIEGDFPKLEKVDFRGRGAIGCFAAVSKRWSPSLKELTLLGGSGDVSGTTVDGNFEQLTKLRLNGVDIEGTLESILSSCGPALKVLTFKLWRTDRWSLDGAEQRANRPSVPLLSQLMNIEEIDFSSDVSSLYFAELYKHCASKLKSVKLFEQREFVGQIEANFTSLERVDLYGAGASVWFSSFSQSCAATLRELILRETPRGLEFAVPEGNFSCLERVEFLGVGVVNAFNSMSNSCAPALRSLRLIDYGRNQPDVIDGTFPNLKFSDIGFRLGR